MYLEKWNAYNKNQNNRTSILLHWLHSFSETETSWSKIRLGLKKCICLLLLKPPSFGFVWQRGHNGLCDAMRKQCPSWKGLKPTTRDGRKGALCSWFFQFLQFVPDSSKCAPSHSFTGPHICVPLASQKLLNFWMLKSWRIFNQAQTNCINTGTKCHEYIRVKVLVGWGKMIEGAQFLPNQRKIFPYIARFW